MSYKQLTEKDRTTIWSMMRAGSNQSEIARKLGCHRSTVSREIARNKSISGYDVHTAQQQAVQGKRHKINDSYEEYGQLVNMLRGLGWDKYKQREFILRHHPELSESIDQILEG